MTPMMMKFRQMFVFKNGLIRLTVIFLLAVMLLSAQHSSCSRKMPGEKIIPAIKVMPSAFLLKHLESGQTQNINSLSAQANIYAESDGMAVEAYANLVFIRGSAVWFNVKKLGVEAARGLITRDSFFIINRLEKTYRAESIESIQRQYSLPEGLPLLQHLLLGSAWLAPGMGLEADIKDSLHSLSGSNQQFSADYRLEEGSFVLRQEMFIQKKDSRLLSVQFGQFADLPGLGIFPYLRRIEAFSPESGNLLLDIKFTDIEINRPSNYRFEIPSHYRREE